MPALFLVWESLRFTYISADMALRLAAAFGTSAEMWLNMQTKYDLWQAESKPRPEVLPFCEPADA